MLARAREEKHRSYCLPARRGKAPPTERRHPPLSWKARAARVKSTGFLALDEVLRKGGVSSLRAGMRILWRHFFFARKLASQASRIPMSAK